MFFNPWLFLVSQVEISDPVRLIVLLEGIMYNLCITYTWTLNKRQNDSRNSFANFDSIINVQYGMTPSLALRQDTKPYKYWDLKPLL